MPPRVLRRAAATVPAFGRYSTCVRPLQSLRSASPCVRPLQSLRSVATVPPCGRYSTPAPGSDQFHEETDTSNGTQLAVGPQPLWLRNHNFRLAQRIMVKRLATSRHDPLGITDSACMNQLVVVSVQYGPFNTYIPIRSTTIDSIGYPRVKVSGESSTTKHRLLHASGPHQIPPPNDPK
ncbi:hypothetical protein F511_26861 [Dorcoceras hygrometricum]|uniref:Uncharacterized protein n=1 Tax=Dorcoceras hygrometricum TaxID=472368 RepID=A0A2Z7CI03_9LAMI|nr:hypothetical protein F511_26861 [Dorcoceras hygrometricum]